MCRTPRAPTRRTLPVQALVHAFHCQDPSCQITTCANTKRVLGRMEAHVQGCRQEVGGTDECKVCKRCTGPVATATPMPAARAAAQAAAAACASMRSG